MSLLAPIVATWPAMFARSTFAPGGSALALVCLSQQRATDIIHHIREFGLPVVVTARCGSSRYGSFWIVGAGYSLTSVLAWCRRRLDCGSLFRVWSPSFSGILGFRVGSWQGLGIWSPGVRYSAAKGFSMQRGWRPLRRGPSALLWAGWLAAGCTGGAPSLPHPLRPLHTVRITPQPVPSPAPSGLGSFIGGSASSLVHTLLALPPQLRPSAVLWRPSPRIRAAVAACAFASFSAAAALARLFPGAALRRAGSGWSVSVPFRGWPGGVPLALHLSVALNGQPA